MRRLLHDSDDSAGHSTRERGSRRPRRRCVEGLRQGRGRGPRARPHLRRLRPVAVHRDHGPVGLGQVDAAALPRRPRPAHVGQVLLGDLDISALHEKELTRVRRDRLGFIFQSYNLIPTLNALENITLPMALAGQRARPGVARPRHRHRRPARPAQAPAVGALRRPAAARRGGPRARRAGPRSSSPTSRPATSTRRPAPRSSRSCAGRATSSARRS